MSALLDTLKHKLLGRRWAYQRLFKGADGQLVLKDLARFCRAHDTTFHPDARVHALLEGRREVFERIARHMNMSPDELWRHYTGNQESE